MYFVANIRSQVFSINFRNRIPIVKSLWFVCFLVGDREKKQFLRHGRWTGKEKRKPKQTFLTGMIQWVEKFHVSLCLSPLNLTALFHSFIIHVFFYHFQFLFNATIGCRFVLSSFFILCDLLEFLLIKWNIMCVRQFMRQNSNT